MKWQVRVGGGMGVWYCERRIGENEAGARLGISSNFTLLLPRHPSWLIIGASDVSLGVGVMDRQPFAPRFCFLAAFLILSLGILASGVTGASGAARQQTAPVASDLMAQIESGITTLVSRHSNGAQGNSSSSSADVSADGRWIAFASSSDNLVDGDTNAQGDIFVHDRRTGETTLISRHSNGTLADNLVDGDTNSRSDIFIYTRTDEDSAPPPDGTGQPTLEFNNFPLSEALLLFVDEHGDLALENVDTSVVARLTSSGDVNYYLLAPTRDRILYVDNGGRAHVIELDFHAGGRLSVQTLPDSVPPLANDFRWAPDGQRLAYMDANFRWWIADVAGLAPPIPLPSGTYIVGGWSHDGQWLSYCTAAGALEVIDVAGQMTGVDKYIECDRDKGGEWPLWSSTAPLLAYARGGIDLDSTGLQPVVFNASTGETIELPVDHVVMGWSPDGRYVALAKKWLSARQEVVESITITTGQGRVIEKLPGYDSYTLGATGWVRATAEEVIFGRYELGDAPGESTSHSDALFGVSEDGATRWWGLVGDASFVVLCTDGDGSDVDVYHSLNPTFPDESYLMESPVSQPGIRVLLSPDGSTAVIDAYEGGDVWRRMLLRCEGGEPLIDTPADRDALNRQPPGYSADSRHILWYESTDEQLAPRVYTFADRAGLLAASERIRRSAAWLVTPNVAPSVTEANAIAGQVTDHTGAPLPGAEVRAGELTTTTDETGAYSFDDLDDGGYAMAVTLPGYVFAAPAQVTVPPTRLAVDFQAEPPAGPTPTGRVTASAGGQTPAETTPLVEGVPEETTEETANAPKSGLGWIFLGSGVVLLGVLLFLMWTRRRSPK